MRIRLDSHTKAGKIKGPRGSECGEVQGIA